MKKYFAALTTTALIGAAPYALAASTADLKVRGVITPAACDLELTNQGLIDLGKIAYRDLNQLTNTLVGTHPIQLSAICNATTLFALNPIDNKSGTSIGRYFGLGQTDDGKNLGFFHPKVKLIMAGTTPLDPIESNDNGANWVKADSAQPDYLLSVATTNTTTPVGAQEVKIDFEIDTYIIRADEFTVDNDLPFEGSATFEVKYL